jgi:hypothetical protein
MNNIRTSVVIIKDTEEVSWRIARNKSNNYIGAIIKLHGPSKIWFRKSKVDRTGIRVEAKLRNKPLEFFKKDIDHFPSSWNAKLTIDNTDRKK